jgi:diaminopimelate epimerase
VTEVIDPGADRVAEQIDLRSGDACVQGIAYLKGHGTENDFVLIPDRAGELDISAAQVRALCDRHAGIGGDGLLRIAPNPDGDGYFMDYRNADGSLAEMCGNGARVFAKFLYDAEWVPPGPFRFGTRGGERRAETAPDGQIRIEMGPTTVGRPAFTAARMTDGSWQRFAGAAVDVGNPHLVVVTDKALADFDLSIAPTFSAEQFPTGVNIEFHSVDGPDAVTMRVYERGVGETRSCGTGTVAVAAAYLASTGRDTGAVAVRVPGGRVQVTIEPGDSSLTGPAVIVGGGRLDPEWWSHQR